MTFSASQTQCSEAAFVYQDTSVEPHKSSYSPEMGQHKGPATTVSNTLVNVSMNVLLFEELPGKVGKFGEEVLLS